MKRSTLSIIAAVAALLVPTLPAAAQERPVASDPEILEAVFLAAISEVVDYHTERAPDRVLPPPALRTLRLEAGSDASEAYVGIQERVARLGGMTVVGAETTCAAEAGEDRTLLAAFLESISPSEATLWVGRSECAGGRSSDVSHRLVLERGPSGWALKERTNLLVSFGAEG